MQHPKRNMLRILLAALLLFVLVACDQPTAGGPGGGKPKDPSAGSIDLSRAIALGLGETTTPSGAVTAQSSGPVVISVDEGGQVNELEVEGNTFTDFAIISGRVFLRPTDPYAFGCALVEVIDDTELDCIDPHVSYFDELQIGPDGTLYYRGGAETESYQWVEVLRKRTPSGETSEVFDLTGPLRIRNWAVASDGLLYLAGSTEGVDEHWLRRVNEDGSLTTLSTSLNADYYLLGVWPDGNLYLYNDAQHALWQIRPDEDTIHPIAYLGGKLGLDEVIHDNDELGIDLGGLYWWRAGQNTLRIQDGRVMLAYQVVGYMSVAELYPNPQRFEPGLEQVRANVARGDNYYFAGRFAPDHYGIVKLDTLTGDTETIYETSLEVFSITVNADATKAFLSAFDASKNRYVMATVDLTTGETTTEPVTSNLTRLEPLH